MNISNFSQQSPWGYVETYSPIAAGITAVSTSTHGGIHLTPDLLAKVPEDWRRVRFGRNADIASPWFEEDSDWCMVALTFPDCFDTGALVTAKMIFDALIAKKLAR